MRDKTILSVDWDWVTGDCAPGGQDSCCGWCDDSIREGIGADGEGRGILRRVKKGWDARISEVLNAIPAYKDMCRSPRLWVAECHADILRIVDPYTTRRIIHLDSHDDNETWSPLCCGTWRNFLPKAVEVKIGMDPGDEFSSVFVCLSSPWTPAELDKEFWAFVRNISKKTTNPQFIGHMKVELECRWRKSGR